MSSWNTVHRLYPPLRAAIGYVASVVAVWMALILILAICARAPLFDFFPLFLSGFLTAVLSIAILASSLLFTFVPFYLFFNALMRLHARNILCFVFGGGLVGALLITTLLAAGSVVSVSGSGFWRAPHWIWMLFSVAGGVSGFVFWLVDVWPYPPRPWSRY